MGKNTSKDKEFPTTYALLKPDIDLEAARALFSHDFVTSAFEAGAHRPKGVVPSDLDVPQPLDIATRRWIVEKGRDALARACLAYAISIEHRIDRPQERKFPDLIRQIRDGAGQIARAADALAEQILRHRQETGEVDGIRSDALYRLAKALDVWSAEGLEYRLMPRLIDGPLAGLDMTHGLANCAKLAHRAEHVLEDYEAWARAVRTARPTRGRTAAAKPKSLPMKSGSRADRDRDAFVGDLANIYEQGSSRKPRPNRGTFTSGSDNSPFMRFVIRVFDELWARSYLRNDNRFAAPSVDAVRASLARRKSPKSPQK